MNKLAILFLALAVSGCATTPREKIIQNILIGAAAGFALGQMQSSHKDGYSYMYAGLGGAGAGLYTAYTSDIDTQNKKIKDENASLRLQIEEIQKPKVAYQTPGMFNSKVPDKYKRLVNPGEWRIYEIDQWVEEGENRLIHQDRIMELIPPSLIPNQVGGN